MSPQEPTPQDDDQTFLAPLDGRNFKEGEEVVVQIDGKQFEMPLTFTLGDREGARQITDAIIAVLKHEDVI